MTAAMADLRATATTMRGFFLADPDELSLLVYVEQFAAGDDPAKRTMYRLRGGNDRLPERMARALHAPVRLQQAARRIVQNKSSVRVTVENMRGRRTEITGDYAIVAVPAPLAAEIEYAPALPAAQLNAFTRLRYGRATKPCFSSIVMHGAGPDGRARARPTLISARCGTAAKTSADHAAF